MMVELDAYDLRNLLVPIEGRAGASARVESLIAEMSHPNIDWKHVVAGIRSYLFDHIHDISSHADTVLPILFHYLREATLRKKGSTLRAGETFFDRYLFVLAAVAEGRGEFGPVALRFHGFARDYLDLMKRESADGYYFEGVNERVRRVGGFLAANSGAEADILDSVSDLLLGQLALHAERSVSAGDGEVESLRAALGHDAGTAELFELLDSVSRRRKREDVLSLARSGTDGAAERFARIADVADFSRNTRAWERICT
ncbi:MAG: hypothetical protein EHM32_06510, partial [Spirochaetales bacterium]